MDFYADAYEKIRILKPNIKDVSIKSYLTSIRKICVELFDSTKPSVLYFYNTNIIQSYTKENIVSLASKKNMLTSILVLVKAYSLPERIVNFYTDYHKELANSQEDNYLDNVKSNKEQQNWISIADITSKINELSVEIKKCKDRKLVDKTQQHLILSLYTMIPPLRNDYVLVKVLSNIVDETCTELDKEYNYINIATKNLLLCKYKTDKYYGIKKIPIPPLLIDIIINWQKIKANHYPKLSHDFLLLSTTNAQPMKHNTLTKYINKIFAPKKVSTTLLRKIYLSEKYPVTNTFREMQEDSYIMGHNVEMARKVYSKK